MVQLDICRCDCDTCSSFKRGGPLTHCYEGACKIRTLERRMVDEVLEREKGLTSWEAEFAQECDRQLKQGGHLSERQLDILEGL